METLTKSAFGALILIHLIPAMVLFVPSLTQRLYGVSTTGDVGLLLVHRGALFLAVVVACSIAVFEPSARRIAAIMLTMSMLGFLFVYFRGGMPEGGLRGIALMDLAGLAPLAIVIADAWKR